MATGTVKWFNNAKGYGFVLSEDKDEDLFIHYSSIEMDGYKSLKAGQEVEYDMQEGPKGMHAVNIRSKAGAESEESAEIAGSAESAGIDAGAKVIDAGAKVIDAGAKVEAVERQEWAEAELHTNPMRSVPPHALTNEAGSSAPSEPSTAPRQVEVELD